MTMTIRSPRPRNPIALLARQRRAGSHRPEGRSLRQQAEQACRREVRRLISSP